MTLCNALRSALDTKIQGSVCCVHEIDFVAGACVISTFQDVQAHIAQKIMIYFSTRIKHHLSFTHLGLKNFFNIIVGFINQPFRQCLAKRWCRNYAISPRCMHCFFMTKEFKEKSYKEHNYLACALSFLKYAKRYCGKAFERYQPQRRWRIALLGSRDLTGIAPLFGLKYLDLRGQILAFRADLLPYHDAVFTTDALETPCDVPKPCVARRRLLRLALIHSSKVSI